MTAGVPQLPELLRVPDLAAVLGVSQGAVRDLIARGEIPAAKLGRAWIVRRAGLLAALRADERRRRQQGLDRPGRRLRTSHSDLARIARAAR